MSASSSSLMNLSLARLRRSLTSALALLKFSMLKAYTVTSLIPISRHHCRVSASFSKPALCPEITSCPAWKKTIAGVLQWNLQISVLCQFSIFLFISVLFMHFNVLKSVHHTKFSRLNSVHLKFCKIRIFGQKSTLRLNGTK